MQAAAIPREEEDSLLDAFESLRLDPGSFGHREHLMLAWVYLQREGFPQGAVSFIERLKAYVEHVGAAGKYHETVTWAYLVLLNEERVLRSKPGEAFDSMTRRRPDLLDHRGGAIARLYSKEQLASAEARRVFVLPHA